MSEAQFMAVERRVYFETRMLAIDSRPFIEEAKPLFSSHPFAAYIQSYTLPRSAVAQRKALLQHLKFPEAQIKSFRLWSALAEAGLDTGANNPGDPAVDWTRLALVNGDTTSIDGQYEFEAGTTDIHSDAAKKLAKVSPRHPALIAERIEEDWDQISGRLAELEPGWGDHPTILAALAQQFISVDDPNKARPYLERLIEQAPDFWAIDALAKTYLDHDDEAGWLKTLRRGLAAPDFGLYHADYNAEIADHFMGKKDYKTAKPYADAAGSSYSSNGLMTAARCEEGLGNWVTAEQWIHRDAERYDHPFAWLTWCVRTGHGNRAAAIEFGIPAIQPVDGMELDRESMAVRASFLLLAGKNTDATAMLRQMLKTYGDPWAGLHLALLSEAAHDTSGRDEALKMVIERGTDLRVNDDSPRPQLVELAGIFRGYLAADAGATLDLAAVDRLTDHLHPPEAANINYMTAKLLDLRNHKPEADRYYVRAAAGPAESTSRILAVQELRARPTATTAPRR
jgi:tetratricopeptide (TPR) repeat protein